jgi:hypothetical protein
MASNLGPDSIDPVGHEGCELNGGEKVAGDVIIVGCDAPEVLSRQKQRLITLRHLIGALVETVESYYVGFVWENRLCAAIDDVGTEPRQRAPHWRR